MRHCCILFVGALVFVVLNAGGCAPEYSEEISPARSTVTDLQPMSKADALHQLQKVLIETREAPETESADPNSADPGVDHAYTRNDRSVDEKGIHIIAEGWYRLRHGGFGTLDRNTLGSPKPFSTEISIVFNDVTSVKIRRYDKRDAHPNPDDPVYKVTVTYRTDKSNEWEVGRITLDEAHKIVSAFAALCPQFQQFIKQPR